MPLGLICKKIGMTRIFDADGNSTAVTVLHADNNRVVQIKNIATDGYLAVQLTAGSKKASRLKKPIKGHYAKVGVTAGLILQEFLIPDTDIDDLTVDRVINCAIFTEGELVDVSAYSKGKGFAGVIKRHNFASGRASHGNSVSHNTPGSIGQRQDPGRVFPGKRMAGHLGDVMVTVQSQKIMRIDITRSLIFIKGGTPGAKSAFVTVKRAVKQHISR